MTLHHYTEESKRYCPVAGVEWNLRVPRLHCDPTFHGLMLVPAVPGVHPRSSPACQPWIQMHQTWVLN
jgi:hypothetical protein